MLIGELEGEKAGLESQLLEAQTALDKGQEAASAKDKKVPRTLRSTLLQPPSCPRTALEVSFASQPSC